MGFNWRVKGQDQRRKRWQKDVSQYCSNAVFLYNAPMRETVTINSRGVITIPAKLREACGLKPNDELILEVNEQGILLRPAFSVPVELYSEARIAEFAAEEAAVGRILNRGK
jgi:antitoxin PrlF